jgi:uncharacterized protein (DUF58 family)
MVRRIQFAVLALIVMIGALSTGAQFLWFLVYLGILAIGGAYVVTRFGLADLEAGYVLDRVHAQAGDILRASYTVRNTSRLPKWWLEVHNPTTLPVPLPGQAVSLGPRGEQSWSVRVPLARRGHYRVEPLALRTGDPLGLFESQASVGSAANVIVYPRVEQLPGWRLPPASIEGAHAQALKTPHTTPHAIGIRPYTPTDSFNRIHWKSTARQGELQVKEFELEQTADVWLYLDLEAEHHGGRDDESTLEYGVRAAASIGARALFENRNVALTATGRRPLVVPPDRGPRQYQKIMQVLAGVQADGERPLVDFLVDGVARLRRGMTAVVITPSLERKWVRPLGGLHNRGVETVIVILDRAAFDAAYRHAHGLPGLDDEAVALDQRAARAMRHALAEHDLDASTIAPRQPLAVQLQMRRSPRQAVRP